MVHKIKTTVAFCWYLLIWGTTKVTAEVTGSAPRKMFKMSKDAFFRADKLIREKYTPDEDYEKIVDEWRRFPV